MKGWVSGLVVGVVLGSALASVAQGIGVRWQSATNILGKDEPGRLGYVEGVNDTLMYIDDAMRFGRPENTTGARLHATAVCLSSHTRRTTGDFLRWADGVLQSHVDEGSGELSAVSLLVLDACK